ncbi:MAG: glycine oxidase ThiO [Pyrinomonadaceae bacterium]
MGNSANPEILIVGGGVIGLSLARELHRRGQRRIAVVERGRVGHEASFAAAGMLAPNAENERVDDFYRLCDESRSMFPRFAEELLAETGIDIELDRSGTLYAAFTEADSEHLGLRYSRQIAAGIPVERLSAAETLSAEPNVAANIRESLFFSNDWQVENRRLVAALRASLEANGVAILENTAVECVTTKNGEVTGVAFKDGLIAAERVVLATGAWTSFIKIGDDAMPFEVRPIRGQMISFGPRSRVVKRVVYSPRGYLVPRADGRVLAGATVEDVGFADQTTEEAIAGLKITGSEIAPCLADQQIVEKWSGLRPAVEDRLPVIGQVPGYTDLFVATAHFRNGILLTPITARLLADLIVNGQGSEYFAQFGAGRLFNMGSNAAA